MLREALGYMLIFLGVASLCSASYTIGIGIMRYFFPPRD